MHAGQQDERMAGCFPVTQWTLLIDVIQGEQKTASLEALSRFCDAYRPAIYQFFRRRGCSHEEAEDHTQSFFASRIIEKWDQRDGFLHKARRSSQHRFRSFLAHVLWRFLQDRAKARTSQKAGGSHPHIPLAEPGMPGEPVDEQAHDPFGRDFDRAFALAIIQKAAARSKHAECLIAHLKGEISQREAAERMEVSEGAFKKAFFDFRNRLARDLWDEVRLVAGPEDRDVREEIKYLMSLFAGK